MDIHIENVQNGFILKHQGYCELSYNTQIFEVKTDTTECLERMFTFIAHKFGIYSDFVIKEIK